MKQTLLTLFLCLSLKSTAQLSTFLSYDAGVPKDEFSYSSSIGDTDHLIYKLPTIGFRITQQVYKQFYAEAGFYIDFMAVDMINEIDSTNLGFAQNQFQIPLRLQFRQTLFKDRIHLTVSGGFNYVIDFYENYYEFITAKETFQVNTINYNFNSKYFLAEIGMGMDVMLTKNFYLGIRYYLNYGIENILTIDAEIYNGNEIVSNHTVRSNGSYRFLAFTLGYRISRIWNKKVKE